MRILVFTTAYKPLVGGAEIALENIIRHLPNVFFDIVTLHSRPGLKKLECSGNYCIHRLIPDNRLGKLIFPIFGFFKGLALTGKNKYQAVHAYQASSAAGAAWLLKIFKPKLPFILTLQEGKQLDKQSFFVKFFRGLIIKKADKITAISNYLKKFAQNISSKADIRIIPNGVDIETFKTARPDENIYGRLGIKKEDRIIISVSRLVEKNGLIDLVQAMPMIKERFPHLKLILIGQGPMKTILGEKAAEIGASNSVIFLDEIGHKELPGYLKIADVFVRPSLSEGLGNSFLEAMAAGVPVVGTPVGGITDFLIDGENGLFCRPRDPQSVAETVIRILSKQELKEKIRTNAQTTVEGKYNWIKIAGQFAELYDEL